MYFAASYQSYCQNKQREYFNMLPADYSFSYWLKFKAMIDSWKGKKKHIKQLNVSLAAAAWKINK